MLFFLCVTIVRRSRFVARGARRAAPPPAADDCRRTNASPSASGKRARQMRVKVQKRLCVVGRRRRRCRAMTRRRKSRAANAQLLCVSRVNSWMTRSRARARSFALLSARGGKTWRWKKKRAERQSRFYIVVAGGSCADRQNSKTRSLAAAVAPSGQRDAADRERKTRARASVC